MRKKIFILRGSFHRISRTHWGPAKLILTRTFSTMNEKPITDNSNLQPGALLNRNQIAKFLGSRLGQLATWYGKEEYQL